ncbi:hypothetical protein [Shewanella loihica]|uniref:Uncharacterized protein n=1 Tax=Shewanella loihica (strain ATCC BAA-1088 / PV-4) TaxID=323850 RepID=A3QEK1_SHELP|nr:hypothetical protein [Shewanella loihica]ABO23899.1 hypothetical protein Shew_2033 [Shewanella loihica PV-4]
MMKLILLTALFYQPLYPNDGTRGASMLETATQQTQVQAFEAKGIELQTSTIGLDVSQLESEIAIELDQQLKALHAELPLQGGDQELLASQN